MSQEKKGRWKRLTSSVTPVPLYGRTFLVYLFQSTSFSAWLLLALSIISAINSMIVFEFLFGQEVAEQVAAFALSFTIAFAVMYFTLKAPQNPEKTKVKVLGREIWSGPKIALYIGFFALAEFVVHKFAFGMRRPESNLILQVFVASLIPAVQIVMSRVLSVPVMDAYQNWLSQQEKSSQKDRKISESEQEISDLNNRIYELETAGRGLAGELAKYHDLQPGDPVPHLEGYNINKNKYTGHEYKMQEEKNENSLPLGSEPSEEYRDQD